MIKGIVARAPRRRPVHRSAADTHARPAARAFAALSVRSFCDRLSRRSSRLRALTVQDIRRSGKRIVIDFGDDLFLVLHLMIAGRLRWREPGQKPGIGPRLLLASFVMTNGTLLFTEASSKKRASMQLVRGGDARTSARPRRHRAARGLGRDVSRSADAREPHLEARPHRSAALQRHRQRLLGRDSPRRPLSPLKLTRSLSNEEVQRLHSATRDTLLLWIDRLRQELSGRFPEKVTAFHDAMAVHGRYKTAVSGLRRARPAHRVRRQTSATTARSARRADACSPTARCRGCSGTTGRSRLTISNQYM